MTRWVHPAAVSAVSIHSVKHGILCLPCQEHTSTCPRDRPV
jgi:hypothetical protein